MLPGMRLFQLLFLFCLVGVSPAYASWNFSCELPNLEIVSPPGAYRVGSTFVVPDWQPLKLRAVPFGGQVYDFFLVFDYDEGQSTAYGFDSSYVMILPTASNKDQQLEGYATRPVDPPPPPPPVGDDEMTDPQMTAIFANMSAQTAKVVTSNANLSALLQSAAYGITGVICAAIAAVTWKG